MDPNANLAEQRTLALAILEEGYDTDDGAMRDAERLAELVQALDGWIARGGALPSSWDAQAPTLDLTIDGVRALVGEHEAEADVLPPATQQVLVKMREAIAALTMERNNLRAELRSREEDW